MTTKTEEKKPQENKPAVVEKTIADKVLAKVNRFEELGQMNLPKDYSAANAVRAAYLILQETTTKDSKPVLQACTQESIANALFKMVTEGLSPLKRQGSFIAYGNKLQWQREYAGTVALAKRYGKVKDVNAVVIYQGDAFKYEIDPTTGRKKVVEHTQDFKNIDNDKILGAYAVVMYDDGTSDTEIMNIKQIHAAWNQGAAKGNSPAHKGFPDQMAMKTVINRACKLAINTSDDAELFDGEEQDAALKSSRQTISENANVEEVTFDQEVEEVKEEAVEESAPEQKEPEVKKPRF